MKELVIVGNSSYAQMMERYIRLSNFGRVVAYVVDEAFISEKEIEGIKVISFEQMKTEYAPENISLIMGIGYKQMSAIRKEKFEKCKNWGYMFENYIHPTAIVSSDAIMGEGNNILENVIVEVGVKIGNANLLFGGSIIGHESTIGSYNTFSLRSVIAGCVQIKNNCFFGAASTVKNHVKIKDYVLLGASAYGFKDMEAYSVLVPAKSVILEGKKSIDYL